MPPTAAVAFGHWITEGRHDDVLRSITMTSDGPRVFRLDGAWATTGGVHNRLHERYEWWGMVLPQPADPSSWERLSAEQRDTVIRHRRQPAERTPVCEVRILFQTVRSLIPIQTPKHV